MDSYPYLYLKIWIEKRNTRTEPNKISFDIIVVSCPLVSVICVAFEVSAVCSRSRSVNMSLVSRTLPAVLALTVELLDEELLDEVATTLELELALALEELDEPAEPEHPANAPAASAALIAIAKNVRFIIVSFRVDTTIRLFTITPHAEIDLKRLAVPPRGGRGLRSREKSHEPLVS